MEQAMVLFSGYDDERGKEYWLVAPVETVVKQYKEAVSNLQTAMNSMGLECSPSEVINIPQGENTANFIDAFKEVQRLSLKLDQYVEKPEAIQDTIEEIMPIDTLQQFRTAYLDLARRTNSNGGSSQNTPEDDNEPDFELNLFASTLIDYDYIMHLIAKYTQTKFEKVKITKEQLLEVLASSVDLMSEREYLRAFIEELKNDTPLNEMEIRRLYKEYKNKRFNEQIQQIAADFQIDAKMLESFVDETTKLRRLDEESMQLLLAHFANWKERKNAKQTLLSRLSPLFDLLTQSATIEGLNAYVNKK